MFHWIQNFTLGQWPPSPVHRPEGFERSPRPPPRTLEQAVAAGGGRGGMSRYASSCIWTNPRPAC
eukprot:scaffold2092_cov275-Prasinococcus_capsulatus_cf.AAC.2